MERVDPGLHSTTTTDRPTLLELWKQAKDGCETNAFANIMADFEALVERRDLYEYYDKKARETLCESLHRANFPSRRPWSGREAGARAMPSVYKILFSLEIMMPNGKTLSECTGAEVGQFGSQFFRLARAIGPDQRVGDVFDTNEKLHEFLG